MNAHPTINQRPISAAVMLAAEQQGFTPLQARILAGRIHDVAGLSAIGRPIDDLDSPDGLPDIQVASEAIADAILDSNRALVLCTDHDCDGSTSHYVLRSALLDYFFLPETRLVPFITHRMREGYGVSDKVVDRMLAVVPEGALCITADQGSTDEARIARMRDERGVMTVVTDHHGIPAEGPPKSAVACVNPVRGDSTFDPCIAGCCVAWLTMCAVRERLIERGWLPKDAPTLMPLLDAVAVGTCADAVDLGASKNNRSILLYGLGLMNASDARPCWKAMYRVMDKHEPFTIRDMGWGIAPRINARGRIGDAMAAVKLLCAPDMETALPLAQALDEDNLTRRKIQNDMTGPALELGGQQAAERRAALVVHLKEGHAGVQGIVASRLVETYGRPTCCLSPDPNAPGVVRGSLRSIPSVDIRAALARASELHPGLLPHFGGHRGAAGIGLEEKNIPAFADALCEAVCEQTDPETFAPVVHTDGALDAPTLDVLSEIAALEPYGREFEPPVFCDEFTVLQARAVGDGTHIKLALQNAAGRYQAIWFHAIVAGEPVPVHVLDRVRVAYTPDANTFRGQTHLDLKVSAVEVCKVGIQAEGALVDAGVG